MFERMVQTRNICELSSSENVKIWGQDEEIEEERRRSNKDIGQCKEEKSYKQIKSGRVKKEEEEEEEEEKRKKERKDGRAEGARNNKEETKKEGKKEGANLWGAFDGILLHIFCHVCILDDGLPLQRTRLLHHFLRHADGSI